MTRNSCIRATPGSQAEAAQEAVAEDVDTPAQAADTPAQAAETYRISTPTQFHVWEWHHHDLNEYSEYEYSDCSDSDSNSYA